MGLWFWYSSPAFQVLDETVKTDPCKTLDSSKTSFFNFKKCIMILPFHWANSMQKLQSRKKYQWYAHYCIFANFNLKMTNGFLVGVQCAYLKQACCPAAPWWGSATHSDPLWVLWEQKRSFAFPRALLSSRQDSFKQHTAKLGYILFGLRLADECQRCLGAS